MKITESRSRVKDYSRAGLALLLAMGLLVACSKKDELPPVMTMNGADTLLHVLNTAYQDPGVTAVDDIDGNVTNKVFVDNQVDVDRMGEYVVNYRVVDEAGNEAPPLSRVVYVYNQGLDYYGDYLATEQQVYPQQADCAYPTFIWVDSTLNWRLVFLDFACNSQREVYADVLDTMLVIPFQLIQDSVVNMSIQGSGYITDTLITVEYTRTEVSSTSYWKADFTRLK